MTNRFRVGVLLVIAAFGALWHTSTTLSASAENDTNQISSENSSASSAASPDKTNIPQAANGSAQQSTAAAAVSVLDKVILQIANGPAFDARLRQTIWTSGRDVTATGNYEQAGQGTGRYNMTLKLDDGAGRHRMQQISDGRLAWKRTEVGESISITRVNLGALTETVRLSGKKVPLAPKLRVGGFVEMLDTIRRDYALNLQTGVLDNRQVLILEGELTDAARGRILGESGRTEWPELCPSYVRVAIAVADSQSDAGTEQPESTQQSGADAGLPIRFEYCSDPVSVSAETGGDPVVTKRRPTISLIEMYSVQRIATPPVERFEFSRSDSNVNFIDETQRYVQPYGLEMTDLQRKRLRR